MKKNICTKFDTVLRRGFALAAELRRHFYAWHFGEVDNRLALCDIVNVQILVHERYKRKSNANMRNI